MTRIFLITALAISATACGPSKDNFSYDLTFNDCTTGKHKEALCDGLKNRESNTHNINDQNKACVTGDTYRIRKEHFKEQGCTGEFVET